MKILKNRIDILVSLVIIAATSALFLSILTRLTDFFFLLSSRRYIILAASILIPAFAALVFKEKIKQWAHQFQELTTRHPFIKIILILNLVCSSLLTFYIPKPKFPLNHFLTIEVLPDEGDGENQIWVKGIRKQFDEPEPGSQFIDLAELTVVGGQFELLEDGLHLRENTIVNYETFFSGCISIFFDTSPDSHMIRVQFDQVEERYSLYSLENSETEVQLCAPFLMQQLSNKWKLIVTGLYVIDAISLFVIICLLEVLVYLFIKLRNDPQKYTKFIVIFFILMTSAASLDQISQICIFPASRNTENMPPLKPSVFQDGFDFGSVYQQSIHTKKFAHAFIINFIDIYPSVKHIYIDDKTVEEFGFGSFEFQRWFAVYDPQPAENLLIQLSEDTVEDLIASAPWNERKFYLEERDKTFYIDYLDLKDNEYVFLTNRDNNFYVIPDNVIEAIGEGNSCCSK